jgi:hypothetical protein
VQYLGFFLIFVALIAGVVGLMQHLKMKKILAAPFKKTGEVAANPSVADPQGRISTEGAVQPGQQGLIAPCSGKPCLYYEIEVIQHWHKYVQTENGTKKETGKNTITTQKVGSTFFVNDGSGPVAVDASKGMDVELEKSFSQKQGVSWGDVQFGQFRTSVSVPGGDKTGDGVECIEKLVAPTGNLFVMGKLVAGTITKEDGMLGKLLASVKGRDALVGSTKTKSLAGFIGAGVSILIGLPVAIFADPPAPGVNYCNITDQTEAGHKCTGKVYNDSGETVSFKVTKAGTYKIHAQAPSTVKIPLQPVINVTDATGKSFAKDEHDDAEVQLEPGDYKINISDAYKGDPSHFKGGFSFELEVKQTSVAAALTSAHPDDSAEPAASASAKPAAVKPAGGGVAKPAASAAAKPSAAPSGAKPAAAPSGAKPAAAPSGAKPATPAPKK